MINQIILNYLIEQNKQIKGEKLPPKYCKSCNNLLTYTGAIIDKNNNKKQVYKCKKCRRRYIE